MAPSSSKKKAAKPRKKKASRKKKARKKRVRRLKASPVRDKARLKALLAGRPHSELLCENGPDCFLSRYEDAILLGMKKGDAAEYAGCHSSTPREWYALAEEDFEAGRETPQTAFVTMVRKAKLQRVHKMLTVIDVASATDWHAAKHALSLLGYQPRKQIELSGGIQTGSYEQDEADLEA